MTEADAKALPDQLAAEIAALGELTLVEAVTAINGRDGGHGLRRKFVQKLYNAQSSAHLSDPLFYSINEALQRACDRVIALRAPIQDREHAEGRGWSSWPLDSLTEDERNAL